uniref:Reverse transcriptase domain-containing protein n=1 Tax=Tanacetum cinerariifolium TaxID=118510 RepID=A0A6L2MI27_TANCI|nr:hypothetical protein [Tanacetum cinerariifolium]
MVIVALVISIYSDVFVESVRSSFLRVILIDYISVEVPVAPEVGVAAVASFAEVPELDTHSSLEADPSESSPPPVSLAPMVSPFYVQTIQNTTNADSSTTPRFVHPSLTRTPYSEAYLHRRSDPLSTMYPPTTSETLAGDSFSESSAGPSCKRCRSPADTMTSSIHATRALVLSHANLLPPRKRFRDSISPEDSVEEDIDMDVLEEIGADATAFEVAVDRDVVTEVDAGIDMEVDVGIDVEDEVKSSDRGTIEVGVDMAVGIDIPDSMLMPDAVEHLEVRADRFWRCASFMESELRQICRLRYYDMIRFRRLETFTATRLEEAFAAYEATRAANALEVENQCQNGSYGDNGNDGDGNGGNGNDGNGNPNEDNICARPVARECAYQDFMKCQPLNFKGMKGVIGGNSVPYQTIGADAAFAMSWRELMKLMAELYCPSTEIQKMKSEL